MSKILIENYRGFDIIFDTDYEKFQCIVTEENAKESTSFTAVKKFVDDYKKANQDFHPFWVEATPNGFSRGRLKIIGIRKDGGFVAENEKGEKQRVANHSLSDFMLLKPENENGMRLLEELTTKADQQREENNNQRKHIVSTLNIVTLKDWKRSEGL